MARYAQFTAESFAARTKPAPPPMPAQGNDYGSLLVVRVGRPKKRPVLMLDPAEAAADAIRFQQIAAEDFANPDQIASRRAVMRLSALAANESGMEDYDLPEPTALDPAREADADSDRALALWTNPAEPIDPSGWNDGADTDLFPLADASAPMEPQAALAPPAAAAPPVGSQPDLEPLVIASAIAPCVEPAETTREPEPEPWLAKADVDVRRSMWRRLADAVRAFFATF